MSGVTLPRCSACYLHPTFCVCGIMPSLENRTRVLVVRHAREAHKTSNTARLAVRALRNSELLSYGGLGDPPDFAERLRLPGTWLLFPSDGEDSAQTPSSGGLPRPEQLVVLDGSWAQCRRMTQRLPSLRGLPRLSLKGPGEGRDRLRRPTVESGMSTLEAIAHALAQLGEVPVAEPLLALHDEHCRRIRVLCTKAAPRTPEEALALGGDRSREVKPP